MKKCDMKKGWPIKKAVDEDAEVPMKKGGKTDKWIQDAVDPKKKGLLHEKLHVAPDKKIPEKKLTKALHSKSEKLRKEAQFAENVKRK